MAKIPLKDGTEFQIRPGVPPFGPSPAGWRGVNTEADPGSLDPNELQRGDNIRLRGRVIHTRPGLTEKADLLARIMHLKELPVDNPRTRLWFSTLGCFGFTIGTGGTILHYDPSETPAIQSYNAFFAETDRQIPMATYGDKLFVGDKSALREVVQIAPISGVSTSSLIPSPSTIPVANFTDFTIRAMKEFDGKLFISLENNFSIGGSKIVFWNGLAVRDDLTAIRPPLAFGIWRDKLVAGFDSTAANIRARDRGDTAPGTWTTYALAGYLTSRWGNAMQEERESLYIASGTDKIFKFDGSALTLANTIAGCATDGFGCTGMTLHRGLLYYVWNTPSAAYATRIGRHDPDSALSIWLDTYKDVTTEQANFKRATSILSYRDQIVFGGAQSWLLATAENDVKGTLEVLSDTGAPSLFFDIVQLLRFP